MLARSLLSACGFAALATAATLDDASLVQLSVHGAEAQTGTARRGLTLHVSPIGPLAETKLGPMLGVDAGDHIAFRGIPYVEPPRRFEKAAPKEPWAPKLLDAREYKHPCVGSSTAVVETEDCLHLNLWLPKGGKTGMPVIVYFHGGLNMHGSGAEPIRQGDGVTQSDDYPTIFVNLDYRLGIFGWIYGGEGSSIPSNLGIRDQQAALQWVHDNIEVFGGDPSRVSLMGQSEGAGNIMAHLVSPHSAGLFSRAIFHSPPAEIWTEDSNKERTAAIMRKTGCKKATVEESVACLKKIPADTLWHADWSPEDMSRNPFSPTWFSAFGNMITFLLQEDMEKAASYLGWHGYVDGDVLPGDIHELIPKGQWNKVPVLLTVSRNESMGCIPGDESPQLNGLLRATLAQLVDKDSEDQLIKDYNASLIQSGIVNTSEYSVLHQIFTDKVWTCEAWGLADEITRGGGEMHLGGFWHAPKHDPVGSSTNKLCQFGATCHAAEMLYSLPQGRGVGIKPDMGEEYWFMTDYRDRVLDFVSGNHGPWEVYKPDHQVITLYDENGAHPEVGYRKKQCAILDRSMSKGMPMYLQRRAKGGL